VEGDPARAREAHLPGLRGDYPAAGSLAPDCPRECKPKLLAHTLFAKYGLHLPLNRQGDVYQHEGIDLDVSTLKSDDIS
jgi:transposase